MPPQGLTDIISVTTATDKIQPTSKATYPPTEPVKNSPTLLCPPLAEGLLLEQQLALGRRAIPPFVETTFALLPDSAASMREKEIEEDKLIIHSDHSSTFSQFTSVNRLDLNNINIPSSQYTTDIHGAFDEMAATDWETFQDNSVDGTTKAERACIREMGATEQALRLAKPFDIPADASGVPLNSGIPAEYHAADAHPNHANTQNWDSRQMKSEHAELSNQNLADGAGVVAAPLVNLIPEEGFTLSGSWLEPPLVADSGLMEVPAVLEPSYGSTRASPTCDIGQKPPVFSETNERIEVRKMTLRAASKLHFAPATKRPPSPSDSAQSYIKKPRMEPTLFMDDVISALLKGNQDCQGLREQLQKKDRVLFEAENRVASYEKLLRDRGNDLVKLREDLRLHKDEAE